MPLKNLTIAKSELTEKQVEGIVTEYIRYDPTSNEIVLLPTTNGLSNKPKVLLYLVALHGWPFVTDKAVPTEATPAQIGEALGIPGGTLRPILKELKDRHLISARGRSYGIRAAALPHVKSEITGSKGSTPEIGTSPKKPKSQHKRTATAPKRGVSTFFDSLISQGYFNQHRTLNDIKERFHEKGLIVPRTSIPRYLLKAIRIDDGRLRRKKKEVGGKKVWVYEKN